MQYDYFIASRYRNKPDVLRLTEGLKKKGKRVYCFMLSDASLKHVGQIEENTEEQMKKYEARDNWREDGAIREIFETDMEALRNSEAIVVLLPAGKSVHIEAGAAYGMGKKCILIGEQKETESLYLIFEKTYSSIEDFLTHL